jgi:hypothetical protein
MANTVLYGAELLPTTLVTLAENPVEIQSHVLNLWTGYLLSIASSIWFMHT